MGKQNEAKSTVEPSAGPVIHSKTGGIASDTLDGAGVEVFVSMGSFVDVVVAVGRGFGVMEGFPPALCIIGVRVREGEISSLIVGISIFCDCESEFCTIGSRKYPLERITETTRIIPIIAGIIWKLV